jgi:ORF6N domain-containing protein
MHGIHLSWCEMARETEIIIVDQIEPMILTIRGQKVVLDSDLATLYATTTKALNQAVKRHAARFPSTFMFPLTAEEKQEVVTNCDHLAKLRFSASMPNAFTEHGALMAASILNTPRAVQVSIFVIQAFVKLRQLAIDHAEILKKLGDLERKVGAHDDAIKQIVQALRQLMVSPAVQKPKRSIGFHVAGSENPQAKRKS